MGRPEVARGRPTASRDRSGMPRLGLSGRSSRRGRLGHLLAANLNSADRGAQTLHNRQTLISVCPIAMSRIHESLELNMNTGHLIYHEYE